MIFSLTRLYVWDWLVQLSYSKSFFLIQKFSSNAIVHATENVNVKQESEHFDDIEQPIIEDKLEEIIQHEDSDLKKQLQLEIKKNAELTLMNEKLSQENDTLKSIHKELQMMQKMSNFAALDYHIEQASKILFLLLEELNGPWT